MSKGGFSKIISRNNVILIGVFGLVAVALLYYSNSKQTIHDGYDGMDPAPYGGSVEIHPQTQTLANTAMDYEAPQQTITKSSSTGHSAPPSALDVVSDPSSLLPTDKNSDWANLNPTMSVGAAPDLLQAGYHIGLDTIGQTLKNANYQLRSDPLIPKQAVGPWMQSTIDPDYGRTPLEIGGGGP